MGRADGSLAKSIRGENGAYITNTLAYCGNDPSQPFSDRGLQRSPVLVKRRIHSPMHNDAMLMDLRFHPCRLLFSNPPFYAVAIAKHRLVAIVHYFAAPGA